MKLQYSAIIEGLLFIYGDDGVSLLDIQTVLENLKPTEIKEIIIELNKKYLADQSTAFCIQTYKKNNYRLQTKPELHPYFAKLEQYNENKKLSHSTIEVLSIIAYKQPITKQSIEEIRNVDCSYQLHKLREKRLIKVVGKDLENNRSNLYAITDNFFKVFNIKGGIEELPVISDQDIKQAIQNNNEQKQAQQVVDLYGNVDDFNLDNQNN
ncbi:SMC-Scp complex subunit ScpB [Mycoplasma capricolum subsp. capripneumoniae]|uniref:Chromosomal segregation and condensation protein B n=1 Tax=Mycoplasma capricolum subsp. capripneumoniae 87001 TaxID=1124992 RepID=A0A9N7BAL4_MYCCC|nr:SMC-Scp complex subunit ScpB [Mycoplasma capricolum]AJK51624.1 chromosomal segregation and condensation protein B [Mycoplasma capricolum subsp. capripneumoniae 87001]AOQ22271.1 SMC-Scp complex subunit ScpB [Mycoplasma capricolum subsp. capripneumoniae M1601]AQU77612.1 SMC-Scp complex subunit ScpB [Mycoplasma capricolum subsp. capripneumoniae]KEY84638.1 Chromosomal segregation and condensation protein B [Mycoplasma capricolum subsp. capripneumoniae 99108]QDL19732.1 SMC-Scp complex subunit Sc